MHQRSIALEVLRSNYFALESRAPRNLPVMLRRLEGGSSCQQWRSRSQRAYFLESPCRKLWHLRSLLPS